MVPITETSCFKRGGWKRIHRHVRPSAERLVHTCADWITRARFDDKRLPRMDAP